MQFKVQWELSITACINMSGSVSNLAGEATARLRLQEPGQE